MPATVEPGLWGLPASRHEAACASGSIAVLSRWPTSRPAVTTASWFSASSRRRTSRRRSAALSGCGCVDRPRRRRGHVHVALHVLRTRRRVRPPLRPRRPPPACHRRAQHAKRQGQSARPDAEWKFTDANFSDDDIENPIVEGRLRRTDCSQITTVARASSSSPSGSSPTGSRRGTARIKGWGHGAAGLSLRQKFERSQEEPYVFPHVRDVATKAMGRAGIADVHELDGIEVHDCFSMSSTWQWTISASPTLARAGRRSRTAIWSGPGRPR